ncbi:putative Tribbles-like protein 2 [Hypsibius exemplaris]|uniref:Tribbles-like protein 2 n=1 Tax=Hypsibius exemplaris TaxID=2072580 RepID=A0A1W0XCA9_HYPEX|nr:putative Tribbles-like protein 2 [Hypsibius exemplaris]
MAPIFSALSPRRIPLSTVSAVHSNNQHATNYQRARPYTRQMFAHFLAKLDGATGKPSSTSVVHSKSPPVAAAASPLRASALAGCVLTLPLRVGPYELLQPWADEVDWFEARNVETGAKALCKVRRTGDARGMQVAQAESRLAGLDFVNPLIESRRQSLPVTCDSAVVLATAAASQEVQFDFHFYPFLNYQHCLHTHIQAKGRLPEEEARRLFRQICDIVRCSHEAGVAMRDLKMRRLVWKSDSNRGFLFSMLDNCTVFDVDKGDGAACENQATPSYVSPEMCRRPRPSSLSLCKVDIWCLGIILFALVMGRYPFYDPDTQRLLQKVAAARLGPLRPEFSPELQAMLHALLHVDPMLRPDIHSVLQHPWLRVAATESRLVPDTPASE